LNAVLGTATQESEMQRVIIVIKSSPNSLTLLPVEKKVFEWDVDEFSFSQEALDYIELLMTMQRAFTVGTSEALEYSNKRMEIAASALSA
jgi:hypothetical protein